MKLLKNYIYNILTLLVALAIVVVISEFCMRIYWPKPIDTGSNLRYSNRDYKKSYFMPNTHSIRANVPININSVGLRNREISIKKPDNVLRIAIFGDSFTFGTHITEGEILSVQLEKRLNMESARYNKVEVLNFGVPGMNTFQEAAYCLNYGLTFDPDIVLVVWTYNDVYPSRYKLQDLKYFDEHRRMPIFNKTRDQVLVQRSIEEGKKQGSADNARNPGLILYDFQAKKNTWQFYYDLKRKSRLIHFLGPRVNELITNQGLPLKTLFSKFGIKLRPSEETNLKIIYSNLDSPGFQLSFSSLNFLNKELKARNIEFHTIIYPPIISFDDHYWNNLIGKVVENHCIKNNINNLNFFSSFLGKKRSELRAGKFDNHPNRLANEIASKAIADYLKQKSNLL